MSKGNLLNGQVTGAQLFLAWSAGTFAAFLITLGFGLIPGANDAIFWTGFVSALVLLNFWQSMLLIREWPRRVAWNVIFLLNLLLPHISYGIGLWIFCIVQISQGVLLFDARERAWAWIMVAMLLNPKISHINWAAEMVYNICQSQVSQFFQGRWFISFSIAYVFAVQIVFGLLASFFMPPAKPAAEESAASD